jgi:pyridoxamine 5'-phosphate oxidase
MSKKNLNLKKLRREYETGILDEKRALANPIAFFRQWLREAIRQHQPEPNAMCLSTCGKDGVPRGRMMLLKGIEKDGFTFYTNYQGNKADQLTANACASVTFYWPTLARQIRIEGVVKKLSRQQNIRYFASRPRLTQIGAWASPQSRIISSRKELDDSFEYFRKKFKGKKIPCPSHWGGYILIPDRIEFWQGRKNRLHDRLLYIRKSGKWNLVRLAP